MSDTQAEELLQQAKQQYLNSVEEEINRICTNLEQINKILTADRAKGLVRQLDGCDMSGQSPKGLAAGAVYLATLLLNEEITQYEISNSADISSTTVQNQYQYVEERAERV